MSSGVNIAAIVHRNGGRNYFVGSQDHVTNSFASAHHGDNIRGMREQPRAEAAHRNDLRNGQHTDKLYTAPRFLDNPNCVDREFLVAEYGTCYNPRVYARPPEQYSMRVPRPLR